MRLIDANKLFKEVGEIKPRNKEHYKSIGEFMNMITNSETIDIRPKGEWMNECENGHGFWVGTCDQCGKENHVNNFCPYCGADMRGTDDD